MQKSVLCVGVAVQDHIFRVDRMPDAAIKVFASDYRQVGGGPAANAAATVARLGARVTLWARVGNDATGKAMIAELKDYGVDTGVIRMIEGGRSSVSTVAVDGDGERLIIAFADANLDRDVSWLPTETIGDSDALLCDVRWPEASLHALTNARERGVPSVLDADLTTTDAVATLFPLATHAVFSEPALARLAGTTDPAAGLRAVAGQGAKHVSVTLGAEGFGFLDENGAFAHIPGFPVNAIDTLAAGDVFHGAYALAVAEGRCVRDAGRFAGATAAIKCSRWGGRSGIPNRSDVEALLASNP
ncbi:PfkB family carbohydrate kinase [Shinella zoogloeoides]|uniref:PfkB family carbohydrate kinase n=1 Tax=Shinella zoogloeoides TaxID=352475 RepID=UPI0028AA5FDF|nr:PfkB family carbohydrate kinase [Shinella zoogloeoides]